MFTPPQPLISPVLPIVRFKYPLILYIMDQAKALATRKSTPRRKSVEGLGDPNVIYYWLAEELCL